nr:MAG TPA: crystallin beta/gamma motif-containing protein [Caudoviricetes sp.]
MAGLTSLTNLKNKYEVTRVKTLDGNEGVTSAGLSSLARLKNDYAKKAEEERLLSSKAGRTELTEREFEKVSAARDELNAIHSEQSKRATKNAGVKYTGRQRLSKTEQESQNQRIKDLRQQIKDAGTRIDIIDQADKQYNLYLKQTEQAAQIKQHGNYNATINKDENDAYYRAVNNLVRVGSKAELASNRATGNVVSANSGSIIPQMTDEERNTYNYIFDTEGGEAAKDYLNVLEYTLASRYKEQRTKDAQEMANSGFGGAAAGTAMSIMEGAVSDTGGGLSFYGEKFLRDMGWADDSLPINYQKTFASSTWSNALQEQVTQNIADSGKDLFTIGGYTFNTGDAGAFLYGTGVSIADNMARNLIFAPFGSAGTLTVMAARVAGQSVNEALSRGATEEEAAAYGVSSAIGEVIGEVAPLDHLLGMVNADPKTGKEWLKAILKQAELEASGEAITTVWNTLVSADAVGELSDYNMAKAEYIQQGMSETEAEKQATKDAWHQIFLDALGGAISGVAMGGGASVVNRAVSRASGTRAENNIASSLVSDIDESEVQKRAAKYEKKGMSPEEATQKARKDIRNKKAKEYTEQGMSAEEAAEAVKADDIATEERNKKLREEILDRGLNAEEGSKANTAAKAIQNKLKSGESVSADEWKNLIKSTRSQVSLAETKDAIKKAAQKSGESLADTDVDVMAAAMEKNFQGKNMSEAENKLIKGSEAAKKAYSELTGLNYETGEVIPEIVEEKKKAAIRDILGEQVTDYAGENRSNGYKNALSKTYRAYLSLVEEANAGDIAQLQAKLSPEGYAQLFSEFYEFGKSGEYSADVLKAGLEKRGAVRGEALKAFETAYELGRSEAKSSGIKNAKVRQAELNAKKRAEREKKATAPKGVARSITEKELKTDAAKNAGAKAIDMKRHFSQKQRYAIAVAREFAKMTDINIVFYQTEDGKGANGWYDRETDTIYIDLFSGFSKENGNNQAMLRTLSHELTHFMEKYSPEHYEEYKQFLLEYYYNKDNGETLSRLIEQEKRLAPNQSAEYWQNEIVANASEMFVNDESAMRALISEHADVAQTVDQWFKKMNYALRRAFKGVVTSGSAEADAAKELQANIEAFSEAQKRWSALLKESVEAKKAVGTAEESEGARFSKRIDSEGRELSEAQQEFFKDSKVRDEEGRLLTVYHGSDKEFFVFDRTKARANMDIQGSFFSPWEIDAQGYGGKVGEYYLNIVNPASEAMGYKALKKFQGQNGAGIKAREYLQSLGYDGVNNGGEEYIAFESNQIKLVTNQTPTENPDIRYSMREKRDYSYDALVKKPDIKIVNVSEPLSASRAGIVAEAKKNAAKIGKFNAKDGSVSVYVKDIDTDIIVSKDGLKHSLDRRLELNAPVVLKAGEILQNSIKINELTPQKAEAETSYVLIGASKNNSGDFYIVRSVVNKFSNELTEMDVLYAINAKKENQLRSMRPGFLHPVTGSTISISDFLDYVNEYFPDVLPESVLRHYGHTERPVGKLGESALYQLRIEDKNRLDILDKQETRLTADLKTLEKAYAEAIRAEYERSIKPGEETSRRAAEINRKAAKRYMNEVGATFHVPKDERSLYLLPIINEIIDKGPAISESEGLIEQLYREAYRHSQEYVVDDGALYKKERDALRDTAIYVDPGTRSDVGDYERFRKNNMGSLKLTSDPSAISLDGLYDMLANNYPNFFSGSTDGAEQLYELSAFMKNKGRVESIGDYMTEDEFVKWAMNGDSGLDTELDNLFDKTVGSFLSEASRKERERANAAKVNRAAENVNNAIKNYNKSLDAARAEGVLAGQMNQGAKDAAELRRVKERFANKEDAYINELRERRAQMTEERKAATKARNEAEARGVLAGQMAQGAKDAAKLRVTAESYENRIKAYRNKLSEVREKRDAALKARQEAFENYKAERADSARREVLRKRIAKGVRSLNTMLLNPTDNKHIPQDLRGAVAGFLSNFTDNSSVFSKSKLDALAKAYSQIAEESSDLNDLYDPDIKDYLDKMEKTVEGKRLSELSADELELVNDVTNYFTHIVRDGNKLLVDGRRQNISELASETVRAAENHGYKTYRGGTLGGAVNWADKYLNYDNITPYYFFNRMGGGMKRLYNDMLYNSQLKYSQDINEDQKFMASVYEKYHVWDWSSANQKNKNDILRFETARKGAWLEMTRNEVLTAYATYKRGKALGDGAAHMKEGGIVVKSKTPEKFMQEYVKSSKGVQLDIADIQKMFRFLTDEQKACADAVVNYLTTVEGARRNETSMALYGYKKFNETYYFPYRVASDYTKSHAGQEVSPDGTKQAGGSKMLKNMGSAKALTPNANAAIVIDDFFKVVAESMNDTARYHAFAVQQDNFMRVLNYKDTVDAEHGSTSVKQAIRDSYGTEGINYITGLMGDSFGGAVQLNDDNVFGKLFGKFKKTAVAANLSVAIQQPSAIMRATAMIDGKYLAKTVRQKNALEEMYEYSSTAFLKNMGRFDIGTGRSAEQYILKPELKGKDYVRQLFATGEYSTGELDDVTGFLSEKADWVTWRHIMNAVMAEIEDTTDLKRGTEEFKRAAGRRFDEVVNATQVYDSILVKSPMMRDQRGIAQIISAFKTEPTLSYNLFVDSISKEKVAAKSAARGLLALALNVFANALLKSIIGALRDRDEDKTYLEKYAEKLANNIGSDLIPILNLPGVDAIAEAIQGFTTELPEMGMISDTVSAGNKALKKIKKGDWGGALGELTVVFNLFGLPVRNVYRDFAAIFNTAVNTKPLKDTSFAGIYEAAVDGLLDSSTIYGAGKALGLIDTSKAAGIKKAMRKGDSTEIRKATNKLIKEYVASGKSENEAKGYIKGALTNYWKPLYQNASSTERIKIRKALYATGIYENTDAVVKMCDNWLKDD